MHPVARGHANSKKSRGHDKFAEKNFHDIIIDGVFAVHVARSRSQSQSLDPGGGGQSSDADGDSSLISKSIDVFEFSAAINNIIARLATIADKLRHRGEKTRSFAFAIGEIAHLRFGFLRHPPPSRPTISPSSSFREAEAE